jgi:cobalt-zinc-cadmium efflux system outer membrane protein
MALRQQHGIAAAGIVIARTYPFNPVWEAKVREANGPFSAGVTNSVSNEHKVLIDVEIRGQRAIRRDGAAATLSRTDWEIVGSETALAIRVARAFDVVLYRQAKQELAAQAVEANRKAVAQVEELFQARQLKAVDRIIIRTELDDFIAAYQAGQSALTTAVYDLYRALGTVQETWQLDAGPTLPPTEYDAEALVSRALEHRADLIARQFAVAEAQAKLRLEIANRFGNPNLGPAYEYDPTRINLIGAQFTLPLPVFNTHKGEIMQREAEVARAYAELRQFEVQVRQDVYTALARLEKARAWLDTDRNQVVRNLDKALKDVKEAFQIPDSGVDLLRVIDVQRKLLKARDSELDAILEVRQALNDLAAAVGDPNIAVTGSPSP